MHISRITCHNIGIINRSRHFLSKDHRKLLYNAMVFPYLNYCCRIWGTFSKSLLHKLIILQKKIVRIIDDQPRLSHTSTIFAKLKTFKLFFPGLFYFFFHRHIGIASERTGAARPGPGRQRRTPRLLPRRRACPACGERSPAHILPTAATQNKLHKRNADTGRWRYRLETQRPLGEASRPSTVSHSGGCGGHRDETAEPSAATGQFGSPPTI